MAFNRYLPFIAGNQFAGNRPIIRISRLSSYFTAYPCILPLNSLAIDLGD